MRRTWGNLLKTTVDAFGKHVVMYDGIPVITDDFVSDAQTQGTSSTGSSGIAVRIGMERGTRIQATTKPRSESLTC